MVRFFTEAKKFIPHLDIQAGFGVYPLFYSIRMGGALSRWSKAAGTLILPLNTSLIGAVRSLPHMPSWPTQGGKLTCTCYVKVYLKNIPVQRLSHLTCFSGCSGSRRVLTELLALLYLVPYTIALQSHALIRYVFTSDACVPSVVIAYW